jgi:diadenosine tetraphosphate (Ap4A) HIT family hydrolase
MSDFQLDQRLKNDTHRLASWPLCEVLLMNDAQYPWIILVPRVEGATELFDLSDDQRVQLDRESIFLGKTIFELFGGDKLNVAALGNVVKQLHIHHVVRFEGDPTWPAPIWGKLPTKAYTSADKEALLEKLACVSDKVW